MAKKFGKLICAKRKSTSKLDYNNEEYSDEEGSDYNNEDGEGNTKNTVVENQSK